MTQYDHHDTLIRDVAEDYVRRLGRDAGRYLRHQQEQADAIGDTQSADVWQEIAEAAERMIEEPS